MRGQPARGEVEVPDEAVTRFRPTSGRISGPLVLLGCLGIVVLTLLRPGDSAFLVVSATLVVAVLAWAAMLRPAVGMDADTLRLRGMFDTTTIPLAAIEALAIRQLLAVRVGERRYVNAALGRTLRKLRAADRDAAKHLGDGALDYVGHVENTIHAAMESARARAGVGMLSDEQLALAVGVRRRPDAAPVAMVAASLGLLIVALVFG